MQTNRTKLVPAGVDAQELDRHIGEMYRDVANEAGRDLHFPTGRQIAARTACQADLWAACIAGASQKDLYLEDIAAAGLELKLLQRNPGYRFMSERARRAGHKYGARSVTLLGLRPVRASRHTSHPDLGGGADVAQAAREEGLTNPTTTEEVSK